MNAEERNELNRLEELLADRALHGLNLEESEELAALTGGGGDTAADDSLDLTAALLHEAVARGRSDRSHACGS